ncbi:hypothetical protein [Dactylosporangium cerinum]
MTTLDGFAALAAKERGLVVVSTLRSDGTIQASLVNAGCCRTRSPAHRRSRSSPTARSS